GREEVVRERFDGLAGSLDFERRPLRWSFESADAMLKFYGETAGPGLAHAVARRRGQGADPRGVRRARRGVQQATDGSVEIDGEYLLVVARRRG
ncbi:MAG TPA: hypothetical protein VK387_03775, partial [Thermoleophilaceae bacterium]|nr:hypothetical protein [Thermoleophilaceae bacterium]